MQICNSLQAPLTICKIPYIFMKISAYGFRLADCALPHAAWCGHNPSLCLEVVPTTIIFTLSPRPCSGCIESSLNFHWWHELISKGLNPCVLLLLLLSINNYLCVLCIILKEFLPVQFLILFLLVLFSMMNRYLLDCIFPFCIIHLTSPILAPTPPCLFRFLLPF